MRRSAARRVQITPTRLLAVSLFAILFGATYRDDATITQASFFDSVVQSPFVLALKSVSVVAFAVPVLALALAMRARFRLRPVLSLLLRLLTVLATLLVSRLLVGSPEVAAKMAIAAGVFGLLVPLAMAVAGQRGAAAVPEALYTGALAFFGIHALLNVLLAADGKGFHDARFLGTTVHPNYLGVQMACCAILALGGFTRRWLANILPAVTLAAALIALVLSGSRSGLVVFAVGFIVYFAMRGLRLWQFLLLTAAVPGGIAYLAFATTPDVKVEQYDRGNTRNEAWRQMWQDVNEAPLVGNGRFPLASENSYLRGWSAIGIMFVVMYLSYFIAAARAAVVLARRRASGRLVAFAALLFGMLVGAVFEGYLLETLSFAMMTFLVANLALDAAVRPKLGGRVPRRRVRTTMVPAPELKE